MIRRPPRSTRTDTSFPTRRSSDPRRPLDLDRNGGEIVVRELADETAELFGQAHIGAQFRRLLGRQAGDVERIGDAAGEERSEEHTSELQSLMRISYAVFCLKKKTN